MVLFSPLPVLPPGDQRNSLFCWKGLRKGSHLLLTLAVTAGALDTIQVLIFDTNSSYSHSVITYARPTAVVSKVVPPCLID